MPLIDSRRLIGGAVALSALTIGLAHEAGFLAPSAIGSADSLVKTLTWAGTAMMLATPANAAERAALSEPQFSLLGARAWLNAPRLRAEDLRGRVVLVNFWTYSCINSLRPLPYLRAWAERYRERGLVVIGVHAPEFGFEKDVEKVREAVARLAVGYPVVLDNDLAIWRSFGNRGWPGFTFIGVDGRIRAQTLGEGNYAEAERLIQRLLAETSGTSTDQTIAEVRGDDAQAPPDWANLRSPETYVGYAKARMFASPGGVRTDVSSQYRAPSALSLNQWSLAGNWTVGSEFATLDTPSGTIRHRFHARDLHLVLGGPQDRHPVRFRITIDGASPGRDHGSDVDSDGWGTLTDDRLYQLVRQVGPVQDRTFEIEFSDPGVRAYSFTFG